MVKRRTVFLSHLRFTIYDLLLYNASHSLRSKSFVAFSARLVRARGCAVRFKEEQEVRAEINIEGMHDHPSQTSVRETLVETAGVNEADTSSKRKTAIVDFDENTVQLNTLIKKIQDLGYTATVSGQPQSEVGA